MSTSNENKNPDKRSFASTDIILIALTIYILIRTPWDNIQAHHLILFFLLVVGFILRATNKQMPKKTREAQARARKAQEQATKKASLASKNETLEDSTGEVSDAIPSGSLVTSAPTAVNADIAIEDTDNNI